MSKNAKIVTLIAVVVVVVILLLSWIPPPPPPREVTDGLTVSITPSSAEVPAGACVELLVVVLWGGEEISEGHCHFGWTSSAAGYGAFNGTVQRHTAYTTGPILANVTLCCNVTYEYDAYRTYYETASANITIIPAVVSYVVVSPTVRTLIPNMNQTFLARVYDTLDAERNDAAISWAVWNMSQDEYALVNVSESEVNFTPLAMGTAELQATATLGDRSVTGVAAIKSVSSPPARTLDYRWHDMFNVPNGPWWDIRSSVSGLAEPISSTYPYLYRSFGRSEGNIKICSSMMLNITGRSLYEINMNERPQFLPYLGNYRGGTAEIDWYMQYLTMEEAERYPAFVVDQMEGWINVLNGTVSLDRDAARAVMGLTGWEFDNFEDWSPDGQAEFRQRYVDWMDYEGKVRQDIFNTYLYPFTLLYSDIQAEKVGSRIVLTYDVVSWGLEVLMASWLREAFMPGEWYYEDFDMHAVIGPESTDLDIETAVEHALFASETLEGGLSCWRWEPKYGDVIPSSLQHPVSDYDPYSPDYRQMIPFAAGSPLWGYPIPYDYTPSAFNLSEGTTLTFEWPGGNEMFLEHGGEFYNTTQHFGLMEVRYAEPMWGDMPPGQITMDNFTRSVTYIGPFDMWTWARDQTNHADLQSDWDQIGLLPYGIPMVEFAMKS